MALYKCLYYYYHPTLPVCVQVLLEDSLGERVWVDRADCKMFVQNVQSAFNTKFRSTTSSDTKADQPVSAGMRCQGYHAVY